MSFGGSVALVTGAAGFVGASLVRRLAAEGAAVHAVVRQGTDRWRLVDLPVGITVDVADLTDRSAVARLVSQVRPDYVFHLARHRGDPATIDLAQAYAHNLDATRYLLDAVLATPVARVVHAGSSLEYDLTRSPLRESDVLAPATVHGVTKAAASMLVQHIARTARVPAVVLRLFTVYGPWEGAARFVPTLMKAALDGLAVAVTHGRLVHDWVFVGDVVDACLTAATASGVEGEIVNIATGVPTSNDDLVSEVEQLCGHPIAREARDFPARPWDSGSWFADVSKARALLGWRARHDLRSGLRETLRWFRQHRHCYPDRASRAAVARDGDAA